jgi:hypothetical protein
MLAWLTVVGLTGCDDGFGREDEEAAETEDGETEDGETGETEDGETVDATSGCGSPTTGDVVPLKEAKLNIEHNATDEDSGFQGAIDSEGWACLQIVGPDGLLLTFDGAGSLGELGLTELFFESVEPANADVPIDEILSRLPEGDYVIEGPGIELGEGTGWTSGTAWLTHDIPAGPALIAPAEAAVVPPGELVFDWGEVTETIDGDPVTIVRYQLIIEKDVPVDPHIIGKLGLQMYVPATTTTITVSAGFLEPDTDYAWEVLAIEESGNQTLSSGTFSTSS